MTVLCRKFFEKNVSGVLSYFVAIVSKVSDRLQINFGFPSMNSLQRKRRDIQLFCKKYNPLVLLRLLLSQWIEELNEKNKN